MTIEQFLGYSAEEMEKLSDEELIKHFGPLLTITKPVTDADFPSDKPTKKKSKKQKVEEILASIPEEEPEDELEEDDPNSKQLMMDFLCRT